VLFGLSDSAVRNKMRLLELPASVQDSVQSGEIQEGAARRLLVLQRIAPQRIEQVRVNGRTRAGSMMWLDDSSASIADKVRKAAAFFESKYGKKAVRCRMNMTTAGPGFASPTEIDGVKVVIDGRILTNHLWIAAEHGG
jgi:ParB-like chromosome segregation protein Spo0J